MAANKFFTIMVVPEKTQKVRKIIIPHYVFHGMIIAIAFAAVLAVVMVLDYANVMNQISENKKLKVENRQLRQSVQVFKNKMFTIENTLDRVKTFATKLRIITNIEDSPMSPSIPESMPTLPSQPALPPFAPSAPHSQAPGPAPPNVTQRIPTRPGNHLGSPIEADTDLEDTLNPLADKIIDPMYAQESVPRYDDRRSERKNLLASLMSGAQEITMALSDTEASLYVQSEFEKLDLAYDAVNSFALETEQETQFILEKLGEKRTLLASTPTRLPTLGYVTSEYGVRISPIDGRRKMHEGIDIANRYGADIIAPADGLVVFSGVKPAYGKLVILDHGNGIETRFAHNSKTTVKVGDRVKRGQRIANVGSTGHSTGPHCHYEVHAGGMPVDPCWYILDHPAICRSR
ncbi:MAG TPA: M23 family metallopeptidase [Oligoflexia bacterium]|nr:M23 family metallopeptidase [Oligoflexia bacterium]